MNKSNLNVVDISNSQMSKRFASLSEKSIVTLFGITCVTLCTCVVISCYTGSSFSIGNNYIGVKVNTE